MNFKRSISLGFTANLRTRGSTTTRPCFLSFFTQKPASKRSPLRCPYVTHAITSHAEMLETSKYAGIIIPEHYRDMVPVEYKAAMVPLHICMACLTVGNLQR